MLLPKTIDGEGGICSRKGIFIGKVDLARVLLGAIVSSHAAPFGTPIVVIKIEESVLILHDSNHTAALVSCDGVRLLLVSRGGKAE